MRHTLLLLLCALALAVLAGCARDNRAVDAFLHDTGTMPADVPAASPTSTTDRFSTTGGVDPLPTRASTYARADALAYARLWAKFGGKPPQPFGFDAHTDAAVLALAEAKATPLP